ncbi:MAG: Na+/H+ antiporter subunit E [Halanaerobiales bacterium]|nr:Na+/H+ antiporter subunit E [Halanaerobiales bacterium]
MPFSKKRRHNEKNKGSTFWGKAIILYIFWILLSWNFDLQHLLLGLVISFLVTSFSENFLLTPDERPLFSITNFYYFLIFLFKLIWEMIKANLKVAYLVLHPKLPISPGMIEFRTRLETDLAKVIYANAITLTPGTLTVEIEDDLFTVHGLTSSDLESFKDHPFERILLKIEGENK